MQTDQKLPAVFLEAMERLLGDDYQEFLNSYDQPRRNGLRVNRLRVAPEEFLRTAPFQVEPVPWADNGFYVDYRDMPARHPWYNAGVYYLQEPSAMAPAQILPAEPGDRVLDLCAAPGGKVDLMTREEIMMYPERILGTVSEIPDYEEWGSGNVKVDGRVWIRIR